MVEVGKLKNAFVGVVCVCGMVVALTATIKFIMYQKVSSVEFMNVKVQLSKMQVDLSQAIATKEALVASVMSTQNDVIETKMLTKDLKQKIGKMESDIGKQSIVASAPKMVYSYVIEEPQPVATMAVSERKLVKELIEPVFLFDNISGMGIKDNDK